MPLRAAGVALLVVGAIVALLWGLQRRLIYLPDSRAPALPEDAAHVRELRIATADGLELGAWYVPPTAGDRGVTVLVCNGNAGHRAYRLPFAEALSARGLAVVLFDYRGYGGNAGRPSEEGLAADVRGVHRHLLEVEDVDPGRLVLFGESLGAAVAIDLAVEHPPAALVLRSPFTSLADIGRIHYPLPLDLLLWDRYPAEEQISKLSVPVLVVAGEDDEIVPAAHSRRLYDAAGEPKRFVEVAGARHNDRALLDGARLVDETVAFIDNHVR